MKILIISKYYPPKTCARSLQMAKVAEALRNFGGCEVEVLAGINCGQPMKFDHKVHYIDLKLNTPSVAGQFFRNILRKIRNLYHLLRWPMTATKAGKKIITTFKPDIILSASVPADCHIVGYKLHCFSKIPWAAFFSDIEPMYLAPGMYGKNSGQKKLRKIFPLYYMRKIRKTLRTADAIIFTNAIIPEFMQKIYKVNVSSRLHIVNPVGSLPNELHGGEIPKPDSCPNIDLARRILHIGLIDLPRQCFELLQAAKTVHEKCPEGFKGIVFIGQVSDGMLAEMKKIDSQLFIHINQIPSKDVLYYLKKTHALLLVEADLEVSPYLPSKLAEYALSGKALMAITPKHSVVRNLISTHGGGVCVDRDIEEIARGISDIMDDKVTSSESLAKLFLPKFVASQYVDIFKQLKLK